MRWKPKDLTEWHTVFAWLPHQTWDGTCVWFERVQRRLVFQCWAGGLWEYKAID